jgi:uncharacterized repeat protein (TIGR02543 family)
MKLANTFSRLSLLMGAFALLMIGCGDDKATDLPCYTVTTQSVGTGSVELSPDSSCYHAGTVVTITAVPGPDWQFDGWSGDSISTENPLTLVIVGNVNLTATFSELPCYTVTTQTVGTGTVEVTPDSNCYHAGTMVTLTAVPGESWAFDSWSGDTTSTENPLTLEITGDVNLVASFEQLYSLTVQIDPTLGGAVLRTPDQDYYAPGDVVEIEALPAQSYGFSHWVYESVVVLDNPTTIVFGNANEDIFCQFGILEGEPDCEDGYVDSYNGGCNSTPEVFQDIMPGQLILATSGTFIFNSSNYRDTDWFQFEATDNSVLTFTATGEFDMQLFLLDGTNGCANIVSLDDSSFAANDTGMVTYTVGPGTYWLWAGVAGFSGWPCPQNYKAWFTVDPVAESIAPPEGRPATKNELSNIEEPVR